MVHTNKGGDILFEQDLYTCTRSADAVVVSRSGAMGNLGAVLVRVFVTASALIGISGLVWLWWIHTQWEVSDSSARMIMSMFPGLMILFSALLLRSMRASQMLRVMLPETITVDPGDLKSIVCTRTVPLSRQAKVSVQRPATLHIVLREKYTGARYAMIDLRDEHGGEMRLIGDIGSEQVARKWAQQLAKVLDCTVA